MRQLVPLAVAAVLLAGCARPAPPTTSVPITDMRSVIGKWSGVTTKGSTRKTDWVDLVVYDAEGRFFLSSYRGTTAIRARGLLTIDAGKLVAQAPEGRAVFTLHEGGGRRVLLMEAKLPDGAVYAADLTPSR
ncbi:MAG: hypothetical protein L0027_17770 [Candidatus Rokubacteria bacterium]|nr:hypothetical protein [Candidatus Rokubacteria bacterium]